MAHQNRRKHAGNLRKNEYKLLKEISTIVIVNYIHSYIFLIKWIWRFPFLRSMFTIDPFLRSMFTIDPSLMSIRRSMVLPRRWTCFTTTIARVETLDGSSRESESIGSIALLFAEIWAVFLIQRIWRITSSRQCSILLRIGQIVVHGRPRFTEDFKIFIWFIWSIWSIWFLCIYKTKTKQKQNKLNTFEKWPVESLTDFLPDHILLMQLFATLQQGETLLIFI